MLINEFGDTALMLAAEEGHTEAVNALLVNGANINAINKDGWTALMIAAQKDILILLMLF